MFNETALDRAIAENLRKADDKKSAMHTSSGKLSASMLGQPVQWQVLKSLGVGNRVFDDYTLRKFFRGNQIEEWVVPQMPGVVELQKPLFYKGVVGFADAIVDTAKGYDHNLGIIPHEIKSVTNAKFKRIEKEGKADEGHQLQAALYALALGSPYYAIDYVASDDLRVLSYLYTTEDIKPQVEAIIAQYDDYMERQEIPVFEARYKWQANKTYNNFPDWMELTAEECQMALDFHYPGAWENYLKRQNNV